MERRRLGNLETAHPMIYIHTSNQPGEQIAASGDAPPPLCPPEGDAPRPGDRSTETRQSPRAAPTVLPEYRPPRALPGSCFLVVDESRVVSLHVVSPPPLSPLVSLRASPFVSLRARGDVDRALRSQAASTETLPA